MLCDAGDLGLSGLFMRHFLPPCVRPRMVGTVGEG